MKKSLKLLIVGLAVSALPVIVSAADAQEHWTKNCKKCHGADGVPKGPMAAKLKIKDYSDPAVQAAMTDDEMFKAIKEGIPDTKMPAYADKLTDQEIHDLVALVRGFAKKD